MRFTTACGGGKVIDLGIQPKPSYRFLKRLWVNFLKVFSVDEAESFDHFINCRKVKKIVKDYSDSPIILLTEFDLKAANNCYLYLDCTVDCALRNKRNGNNFAPLNHGNKRTFLTLRHKTATEFYNNCRGIFVMGEWLKADMILNSDVPQEKIYCVGAGCNIDITKVNDSQKEKKRFLFVGIDFERKGGPLVVKAFSTLNSKYPNQYELHIVGPHKWPLSYNIPENIIFHGNKSINELIEIYNMCDVFVMPSYFEAYGIVFVEALIFGLPVIARNAYAMKEIIEDGVNGRLLQDENEEELAELMFDVINNDEMITKVKKSKNDYIKQYSWETVAEKMIETFRKDGYTI